MAGAVCPACGVAVVPGYVRCPKCHRPLPRFARNTASPVGGTTIKTKQGSPLLAIAVIVGGGFIAFFALRGNRHHEASAAPAPVSAADQPMAPTPTPTSTSQ